MTRGPTSKESPALPGRLVSAITIASGAIFSSVPALFGRSQTLEEDNMATVARSFPQPGIDTQRPTRQEEI
jgi:hypothetical protein